MESDLSTILNAAIVAERQKIVQQYRKLDSDKIMKPFYETEMNELAKDLVSLVKLSTPQKQTQVEPKKVLVPGKTKKKKLHAPKLKGAKVKKLKRMHAPSSRGYGHGVSGVYGRSGIPINGMAWRSMGR